MQIDAAGEAGNGRSDLAQSLATAGDLANPERKTIRLGIAAKHLQVEVVDQCRVVQRAEALLVFRSGGEVVDDDVNVAAVCFNDIGPEVQTFRVCWPAVVGEVKRLHRSESCLTSH